MVVWGPGGRRDSCLKLFPMWVLYWLGLRPAFLPHLEAGPSLCQSKETLHSLKKLLPQLSPRLFSELEGPTLSLGFWEQPKVCLGLHVATSPRRGLPRKSCGSTPPTSTSLTLLLGALLRVPLAHCLLGSQTSWVLQPFGNPNSCRTGRGRAGQASFT